MTILIENADINTTYGVKTNTLNQLQPEFFTFLQQEKFLELNNDGL